VKLQKKNIKTPKSKTMINTSYISTASTSFPGLSFLLDGREIVFNVSLPEKNWAFIDMQNLYKGVQEKGWKINWKLFRQYLKKKYDVTKAVVFIGYVKENTRLYHSLRNAGFILEFREVNQLKDGKIDGGNVDADLASYVMDYKNEYEKAVIIADDGDYCRTIESLVRQNKLELIISSHSMQDTSYLIKRVVPKSIISIESLKSFIEFKPKES